MNYLISSIVAIGIIGTIYGCGSAEDGGVAGKNYSSSNSSISYLSAGLTHTCIISSLGPLCWGGGWKGQLGTGNEVSYQTPTEVTVFPSNITAIEVGDSSSTCAIAGGTVYCVGDNEFGQLGNSATPSVWTTFCANTQCYTTEAVAVKGLSDSGTFDNATQISLGVYHGCGVTEDGGAVCWGYNGSGQLGDATNTTREYIAQVSGLTSDVTKVEVGADHSCAIVDGGVKCWGDNTDGQLGDNQTCSAISCSTPVDATGLTAGSGVIDIAIGDDFSCALIDTGAVQCWGENLDDIIDNTGTDILVPTAVALSADATEIHAGDANVCALVDGAVQCWGDYYNGTLGDGGGSSADTDTPVDVDGLGSGISRLSMSNGRTACAVRSGDLYCWGSGLYGNLGDGTSTFRVLSPVQVIGLSE